MDEPTVMILTACRAPEDRDSEALLERVNSIPQRFDRLLELLDGLPELTHDGQLCVDSHLAEMLERLDALATARDTRAAHARRDQAPALTSELIATAVSAVYEAVEALHGPTPS